MAWNNTIYIMLVTALAVSKSTGAQQLEESFTQVGQCEAARARQLDHGRMYDRRISRCRDLNEYLTQEIRNRVRSAIQLKILNRQCEAHVESIVYNTTRIKFPEDIQGCWESMENDKASNAIKADDLNFCERRTRVLDQNKAELAKINNFLDSYYGLCNKHIGAVSMANCDGQQ